MIIKAFLPILAFVFICCGHSPFSGFLPKQNQGIKTDTLKLSPSAIDTNALQINFKPGTNYTSVKLKSSSIRKSLQNKNDSVQKAEFEDYLLNEIIPFWYKTPWDFSGYTDVPGQGVVACGYFVSTVLKHAGFNVNRYKLAQQNPLNEAKSIACGDSVMIYEINADELQTIFKEKFLEGIYFVGLDFHVGFLLFRNDELFFIHSNYINSQGVIFEKALYSDAFNASGTFRIAPISTNALLLRKWFTGNEITIVNNK